jgi:putative aldouronate transport system permease protein
VTPAQALLRGRVLLLPKGFDLSAYRLVFGNPRILTGLGNTLAYTLAGTLLSVLLTTLTAYPLAQPNFQKYAKIYMRFVVFTMLFSGGLIPTYLAIRNYGLVNSFWVMVLPGAVSPFYLILTRTFMQQIPYEMHEAGVMEGASDLALYLRVVIPLSAPIIACITLYYAVGIWNNYMTPLIYLSTESKFPLQIFLRQIVLQSAMQEEMVAATGSEAMTGLTFNSESLKSATLVISTVPILIAYPFLQKYFVKGIMVGAIKG